MYWLLVYDMYHSILDNSNLGYIGITGAMAWELPSEPIYLEEALQEAYENGGLPLLDRNDAYNTNADTTNGTENIKRNDTVYGYYGDQTQDSYYNKKVTDSYYAKPKPEDSEQYQNYENIANKYYYAPSDNSQTNDKYYSAKSPDRYYASGNYYQNRRPESSAIDKISNKMDYYFSYADKFLNTIHNLANKKYNPWDKVKWDVSPSER